MVRKQKYLLHCHQPMTFYAMKLNSSSTSIGICWTLFVIIRHEKSPLNGIHTGKNRQKTDRQTNTFLSSQFQSFFTIYETTK